MDLTIIIPAFNEADSLSLLLKRLAEVLEHLPCRSEVIVIDDGSTDGTKPLLLREESRTEWLRVLTWDKNLGMGAALKHGTSRAAYPIVAWVMADRADRLGDLLPMRQRILDGADLVVASRAATSGSYGDFVGPKAVGSRSYSWCASRLLGIPIHDLTNAFRAFRREAYDRLVLSRNDFAISPEMVFRASALGLRIEEIPTVYSYRKKGMSNFRVLQMGLVYGGMALRAWARRRSRKRTS